ncbi:hypothetical protein C8Q74DRAFT_1234996 [Fomes fomentarius]|nr:hypothetical protein C8Q74DRAFT_1234996 [Fomes fomentarius]
MASLNAFALKPSKLTISPRFMARGNDEALELGGAHAHASDARRGHCVPRAAAINDDVSLSLSPSTRAGKSRMPAVCMDRISSLLSSLTNLCTKQFRTPQLGMECLVHSSASCMRVAALRLAMLRVPSSTVSSQCTAISQYPMNWADPLLLLYCVNFPLIHPPTSLSRSFIRSATEAARCGARAGRCPIAMQDCATLERSLTTVDLGRARQRETEESPGSALMAQAG